MSFKHILNEKHLRSPVAVYMVGAGGTGSRMLEKLVCLHRAMKALGHPYGLRVTLIDDDTVSHANIGRKAFYPGDVGCYKSDVLINRANMALGDVAWKSSVERITTSTSLHNAEIVIGAVDNRAARLAMLRGLERPMSGTRYWLDMGNTRATGQAVLGQVSSSRNKKDDPNRLPHIAELYPEMIDPKFEAVDDTPSCSLAEALHKQSLFINAKVAESAAVMLSELFTAGGLDYSAVFTTVSPRQSQSSLEIDPQAWKRFGVNRTGLREKIVRPSQKSKKELALAIA